ncbi:hypothetical protein J2X19_002563 [Rhodoferax ferrireducens]|uniref:Uncharacterized protein n=1 Tax=Rhodoferax ferrireducens TaxID=192843 RepID=A0ABU2C9B5_9BURK|nr:hypothetical protein [Rhodoferax ferrireducens]MDR7377884.1 hypothetical protein [Rhodoferax ferrireducens]
MLSRRHAHTLLLAGLAGIATGWWTQGSLPAHQRLAPATLAEPLQTATSSAAFTARVGQVDYRITPRYDYELSGLVVSRHDSAAWWDWIHAASNDHLNVVDLCVVWGANAAAGAYERMAFSSGQFVCYFSTDDDATWRPDYVRALSNNHLLTDSPRIARQLRGMQVGDQIRLRGSLVEYAHNAGFAFFRGTSTSRDDTGNGACETIFVREASVLQAAPAWPRWLSRLGWALLVVGLMLLWKQPYRARG